MEDHIKKRKEADEASGHKFKINKREGKLNYTKYGKPGHNVRTCRGKVGGNMRLNPVIVANSYMRNTTPISLGRRNLSKLPVSLLFILCYMHFGKLAN